MNKRRRLVSSILLLSVLVVSAAWANGTPSIDWYVMGGGGERVEAGLYALDGTIGQAVVGSVADAGCEICSGFWGGVGAVYTIYLPLVMRNI